MRAQNVTESYMLMKLWTIKSENEKEFQKAYLKRQEKWKDDFKEYFRRSIYPEFLHLASGKKKLFDRCKQWHNHKLILFQGLGYWNIETK